MINMKKIMVATDFSDHSEVAIKYAAEFANAFGGQVTLVSIVEEPTLMAELPPMGEAYFPPNLTELQKESAQKECEKQLGHAGIEGAEVVIGVGTPFVEIVKIAREQEADLLIIGTHGRGAIAHMLLGSVAERIVRKSPCPVLTVRSGEHEFVQP